MHSHRARSTRTRRTLGIPATVGLDERTTTARVLRVPPPVLVVAAVAVAVAVVVLVVEWT